MTPIRTGAWARATSRPPARLPTRQATTPTVRVIPSQRFSMAKPPAGQRVCCKGGEIIQEREEVVMAAVKSKTYKTQSFDHLQGLDGISDAQVEEHLKLYAGYVKQVNAMNGELAEMLGRGKASGTNPEFAEITRRLGFE